MVYYYDKDGNLLEKTETLEEMSKKTGRPVKSIMRNIRGFHYRELGHRGIEPPKHAYPYYKMDDFHPAYSKALEQRYMQLYFSGADKATIQKETGITDRQYYYYKYKLFGDIEEERQTKSNDPVLPEGFWDEWEEAVSVLFKSGKDLRIPIVKA